MRREKGCTGEEFGAEFKCVVPRMRSALYDCMSCGAGALGEWMMLEGRGGVKSNAEFSQSQSPSSRGLYSVHFNADIMC